MARKRTERRIAERAAVKDAKAGLRLAALEPGGAPDRPLVVVSASVIEPIAASTPCAACGGSVRVEEHVVEHGLRVTHVRCAQCGVRRSQYFRIAQAN
jgi:hypothetical protein